MNESTGFTNALEIGLIDSPLKDEDVSNTNHKDMLSLNASKIGLWQLLSGTSREK